MAGTFWVGEGGEGNMLEALSWARLRVTDPQP